VQDLLGGADFNELAGAHDGNARGHLRLTTSRMLSLPVIAVIRSCHRMSIRRPIFARFAITVCSRFATMGGFVPANRHTHI
jgi:hypothetical protein